MGSNQRHHNHLHQPPILPRLLHRHTTRNIRILLPNLPTPHIIHPSLRRRIPKPHPTIHPRIRRPSRAIQLQHRHPPLSHRPNLVLRLLPNRHQPTSRQSPPPPLGWCPPLNSPSPSLLRPNLRTRHLHPLSKPTPLFNSTPTHPLHNLQPPQTHHLWPKHLPHRLNPRTPLLEHQQRDSPLSEYLHGSQPALVRHSGDPGRGGGGEVQV